MKGVVLAAGVGSRLRPLTSNKPKCLVEVNGKPLLDYQLDAYRAAGIGEVVIVTGYEAAAIENHVRHIDDLTIRLVENVDFESTNNMYSLYLCRDLLRDTPFVLNNADLAVDDDIVARLVQDPRGDLIAVDSGQFDEESMKITLTEDGERVTDIAKTITEDVAYGNSIDHYKFSVESGAALLAHVVDVIEVRKSLKDWTEVALQTLIKSGDLPMQPLDIAGARWVEVDNYVDLAIADMLFSELGTELDGIKVAFVDIDGTLVTGDAPIAGGAEFVERARARGIRIYFLSNNSSRAKSDYVTKLAGIGITATVDEIVLSTDGLASFLLNRKTRGVYVLGTRALKASLEELGLPIVEDDAEYVVVGYDTELDYAKLRTACRNLNRGADILATHPDVWCPSEDGPIPDIGALLQMLEATVGKKPVHVFGKPQREMITHLITEYSPDEVLVVGDRLYTDVTLAKNAGVRSAAVLSGETQRDALDGASVSPDIIVPSVANLLVG